MGNKDRNKKKRKSISFPNLPRTHSKSKEREKRRGDTYDYVEKHDDYGFLGSQKCQTTKRSENHHTDKRIGSRQRQRHIAQEYDPIGPHNNLTKSILKQPGSTKHAHQNRHIEAKTMEFYPKVAERQSRSTSRPACLLRSSGQKSVERNGRSKADRSRSKSRDIVALYTNQALPRSRSNTPAGSLRSYLYTPTPSNNGQVESRSRSCTPARSLLNSNSIGHMNTSSCNLATSGSTTPVYGYTAPTPRSKRAVSVCSFRSTTSAISNSFSPTRRARSETRCNGDLISLTSNLSAQSRALSNSEIASQNLELWMNTTSKSQKSNLKKRTEKSKPESFVTLLEMDEKKNEALEKQLNNSNSLNPANIKMMMIAGYAPSDSWESEDEVEVKAGTIITGLYKQNEWLLVVLANGRTGYVPFAYTKPIKVAPLNHNDNRIAVNKDPKINMHSSKLINSNVTSILKKPKPNQTPVLSHTQNYEQATQRPDRDSLSSSNSMLVEELLCAQYAAIPPRPSHQQTHFADCLIVDSDYKTDELRAYCSDSGISEPNSNHSDDVDLRTSLTNTTQGLQHQNREIRNVSSVNFLHEPHNRFTLTDNNINKSNVFASHHRGEHSNLDTKDNMSLLPLGLLGERLQSRTATPQFERSGVMAEYERPVYSNISEDMRQRAQSSSQFIPKELKPEIPRNYNGPRVRVIYDYVGENEDDVNVQAGEVVTLLNDEDIEWIWVMRKDGCEGFMPREYMLPINVCKSRHVPPNKSSLIVSL